MSEWRITGIKLYIMLSIVLLLVGRAAAGSDASDADSLDRRVKAFLESHRSDWHDWNIPAADGKVLYDLILRNNYTRALEIGTSTGRSAIWMAWALSKTGGKLITIEIDKGRHAEALKNFRAAGLSDYIDARLADAHELVKELEGPFDFIFMDADKTWYTNYFRALYPKMEKGGCIAAHNVANKYMAGIMEYLNAVKNTPGMETEMINASSSGISASYKQK